MFSQLRATPGCAADAATFAHLVHVLSACQQHGQVRQGSRGRQRGERAAPGGPPWQHQHQQAATSEHRPWTRFASLPTLTSPLLPLVLPLVLPLQVVALHDLMLREGHTPDASTAQLVLGAALAAGEVHKAFSLAQSLQVLRWGCRGV